MAVSRYTPSVGLAGWNIKELGKEERDKLKKRLVLRQVRNEQDYKNVIAYMYAKFPHEMDLTKLPDGSPNVPIQWRYTAGKNKVKIKNFTDGSMQDMYAFIIYDSERDYEPVAFAGSYFTVGKAFGNGGDLKNEKFWTDANGKPDKNGKYQIYGDGIVMFVDPDYRKLGLATDLWWAEAKLYQESLNIRYQREIQNEYSLKSTQKMFENPDSCIITSPGRLKNDGTRCQIRCLLDYTDSYLAKSFDSMLPGLKTINNKNIFENYITRESKNGVTKHKLEEIFNRGKL